MTSPPIGKRLWAAVSMAAALTLTTWTTPAAARVTKITILTKTSPAFCTGTPPTCPSFGNAGQYETLTGQAEGVLDPRDPLNAIIQDIDLGKDPDGKVRYTATFQLVKPIDMSKASGLLWEDVPNRGGRITIVDIEKGFGDVGLSAGWQGDNSGSPTGLGTLQTGTTNEWVRVPVAHGKHGQTITGEVLARIVNRSGPGSQLLFVQSNQFPYRPATLDTSQATITVHLHETMNGDVTVQRVIPSTDWAWAKCTSWADQTPDPQSICLKDGFDPNLLYQVSFTAKDPYVLGVGFAAFRDLGSFFKFETKDDFGNPNPVARKIRWSIARGVSQSGNMLRQTLHLGFTQDEHRRQVWDGAWPIIAGRRIALNVRWAQPDGVLELYEAGSEGPQWWADYEDDVRDLPRRGILDRCRRSGTCPKIIEHFGAAEVWELKLPIEWVGTDGKRDIPIPENVRRYYIPSTTHGGGRGGFDPEPPAYTGGQLPGQQLGPGHAPRQSRCRTPRRSNAIRVHFRDWVMNGTKPPGQPLPDAARRGPRTSRGDDWGQDDERDGWNDRDDENWDQHHHGKDRGLPGASHQGGDGLPRRDPRAAGLRPRGGDHHLTRWGAPAQPDHRGALHQPGAGLQVGPGLRLQQHLGHPHQLPAEDQAGDQDARPAGGRRRQRAGWRAGGAPRRAARLVLRLEHHRRRVPQGPELRLHRRDGALRQDAGQTGWRPGIPGSRWRSATGRTTATCRRSPRPLTMRWPRASCSPPTATR